jgi:hypothetical protein
VLELRSLTARARYRATIERDIRAFKRRNGAVLATPSPPSRPPALIVSLSSFPYQLKLEGMLAKALELKGLAPVIAVLAGTDLPKRYFEAFGFDRFVELESDDAREAEREATALLAGAGSFGEVRDLRFRGVPLGRHVLSTASRLLHAGSIDVQDAETGELLEQLAATVARSTVAAERLLEELAPALVLFNERNYAAEAPISDVALARGVNVVQWIHAFQDDALVFKRYTPETNGVHPRSLSEESWARVRTMEWTDEREAELQEEFRRRYAAEGALDRRNHGWTRPFEREEIVERLGLDPGKRTAVLFSHILWDANMFFRGEDLFEDQATWFVETVRAACENDRVDWLVKLHPGNVWKLKRDGFEGESGELRELHERIGELPAHVKVLRAETDISARSIFDLADWGITIRGSVGIELPCFGVPVLTAGTGYYSGRGFTLDFASAAEYLECVRSIDTVPPIRPEQQELAKKHAYALFCLRTTTFTSFTTLIRPLEELGHPLDHDLAINVRTREELEQAEDLRRFADWAVDSRDLDYLQEPPSGPR